LSRVLDEVKIGIRGKGLETWMIVSTTHVPFFLKDVPILRIPGVERRTPRLADYIGGAVIETEGWEFLVNPRGVGFGIGTRVAGHAWLVIRGRVGGVMDLEQRAVLGDAWVGGVCKIRRRRGSGGLGGLASMSVFWSGGSRGLLSE
jgi:hypothetical protein